MSVFFPLVDERKNLQNNWELVEISEIITVPSSSPYIVRLREIPDNGSIETKPTIIGLTLNDTTYTPANGYFSVKYSTGDIIFNSAQSGNSYTITYYGKGSLIEADDINYLYYNSYPIRTELSSFTILSSDYTILLNGSSNIIIAQLPSAKGLEGKIYNIKCIDNTFNCYVAPFGTESIDSNNSNFQLFRDEIITIQSNGNNWYII